MFYMDNHYVFHASFLFSKLTFWGEPSVLGCLRFFFARFALMKPIKMHFSKESGKKYRKIVIF